MTSQSRSNRLAALTIALVALAVPASLRAQSTPASTAAASSSPSPAPTPDLALVQQFETFFNDVLAGQPPTQNLTSQMRTSMTPAALAPVEQYYASLGTLSQFQYLFEDRINGYRRYHFLATFSNGSQKIMFVLDSSGDIAGFFDE
ncbi:MAG TPA: hypothetical protein VGK84_00420 [Candidatus Tumulicola sp.]|jgi:hypothetical protein